MHVALQFLEPLLVLDSEVLLLVDDQQAEVAEGDTRAKQRPGPTDDVLSLAEDHILRSLLALVRATVRTNVHQRDAGGNTTKALLTALRGAGLPLNDFGYEAGHVTSGMSELEV